MTETLRAEIGRRPWTSVSRGPAAVPAGKEAGRARDFSRAAAPSPQTEQQPEW
jgi:hypothetical protein